ncbi:hypothetical protein CDL12_16421 [Handroanthus impetiginosus]|uniref:Uncharacterized protein n=1 Tax=Handroanthus impetiginosus TaxID=429701 RepID=A0A2G9H0E8_9LAMI|nr:hypothetical protein CDL12_16421 [Handroanthus impetiginosus]
MPNDAKAIKILIFRPSLFLFHRMSTSKQSVGCVNKVLMMSSSGFHCHENNWNLKMYFEGNFLQPNL